MRVLIALMSIALVAVPSLAFAEDGAPWRRTTPRASLVERERTLALRVPSGRAWGAQSEPIPIEPGASYAASVALEVPAEELRNAFLRVALYPTLERRGRQRAIVDTPLVGPDTLLRALRVNFAAPRWAVLAKLRVLVRRGNAVDPMSEDVVAFDPRLRERGQSAEDTILRPP